MKIYLRLSSTLTFIQTVYVYLFRFVYSSYRPIFLFGKVQSILLQHPYTCVNQMLFSLRSVEQYVNTKKNDKIFIVNSANNLMRICWFDRWTLLIFLWFDSILLLWFTIYSVFLLFASLKKSGVKSILKPISKNDNTNGKQIFTSADPFILFYTLLSIR